MPGPWDPELRKPTKQDETRSVMQIVSGESVMDGKLD